METRPRTGSLRGWRSYRGKPSDRWHVGLTSLPVSLVSEESFLRKQELKKKNNLFCNHTF